MSGRQIGSCCRWYALNGASTAIGRELSTSFESALSVSFQLLPSHCQVHTLMAPKVYRSMESAHCLCRIGGGHPADELSAA